MIGLHRLGKIEALFFEDAINIMPGAVQTNVESVRLAAGLSQTALAGSAFSPSYISLIEAGHREPTDAALAVLATDAWRVRAALASAALGSGRSEVLDAVA